MISRQVLTEASLAYQEMIEAFRALGDAYEHNARNRYNKKPVEALLNEFNRAYYAYDDMVEPYRNDRAE